MPINNLGANLKNMFPLFFRVYASQGWVPFILVAQVIKGT